MPRKGMRSLFSSFSSSSSSSSHSQQPSPHKEHHHRHRAVSPSRHTFSDSMMEENIAAAEEIIARWNPELDASLFSGSGRSEAFRFIRATADLHRAMLFFSSPPAESAASAATRSSALLRAHSLLSSAMRRLEREMHLLLSAHYHRLNHVGSLGPSSPATSDASDIEDATSSITDVAHDNAARDLRSVSEAMISCGYGRECVRIYKTMRKSFVDETIYSLGFDMQLSQSQVQKLDSAALDSKIRSWLAAVPNFFRTLFSGERLLCDHVFACSEAIQESCFADVTRDAACHLLIFPELVARSKRSPEKLFRILDLYDAISDIWPDIESIFAFESTAAVRSQAVTSLLKLAVVARSTLTDFEAAIQRDSSKSPVPGGDVHPLTRYVMNYLAFLVDYEAALADIFADFPFQAPNLLPESLFDSSALTTPLPSTPSSPSSVSTVTSFDGSPRSSSPSAAAAAGSISVRIAWLVLVLICKLDSKAELYREVALSYLFLVNNIQYIVRKVKESGLRPLLGDEWLERHSAKGRHYMARYMTLAWGKVSEAIPEDVPDMTEGEALERMQRFNSAMEAACQAQEGWLVENSGLREEVRAAVADKIVPAYKFLYERCRTVRKGSNADSSAPVAVVRFSPEDVRNRLDRLFIGSSASGSSRGSNRS